MTNNENARDFYYESALDELLTDEESAFLDELLENKELLDDVLIHLPPDMEVELAAAEDNAMIDALVDEIEAKSGRKLTEEEKIELENDVLMEVLSSVEEE